MTVRPHPTGHEGTNVFAYYYKNIALGVVGEGIYRKLDLINVISFKKLDELTGLSKFIQGINAQDLNNLDELNGIPIKENTLCNVTETMTTVSENHFPSLDISWESFTSFGSKTLQDVTSYLHANKDWILLAGSTACLFSLVNHLSSRHLTNSYARNLFSLATASVVVWGAASYLGQGTSLNTIADIGLRMFTSSLAARLAIPIARLGLATVYTFVSPLDGDLAFASAQEKVK